MRSRLAVKLWLNLKEKVRQTKLLKKVQMGLRSNLNKVRNPLNISAMCTWYLKRIYRMNQATRWKENRGQNPHKCVSFRSLGPSLSKITLQFVIQKNLHLTHTVLNQEQFQCANIVFACLWKSCVTCVGCHQVDGSKGCVGEEWGQHWARWGSGLAAEGIYIHAPKATTQVKILH